MLRCVCGSAHRRLPSTCDRRRTAPCGAQPHGLRLPLIAAFSCLCRGHAVRHVACAIYLGSGGGFSWRFGLPDYQVGVTAAYITSASVAFSSTWPPSASYNDTGRGYPDVASLAQFGIPLCTYGGCSGSGGTSASAPTVAGMLSLVNDARLDGALPPLGFINPRLCAARPVARCVVYVVWRGACRIA